MKTILGLDLGTNTGFALGTGAGPLPPIRMSGTWTYKITRFDSPNQRFKLFRDRLDEVGDLGIDVIYFEAVMRHLGNTAAHVYGGFLQTLQEWGDTNKVRYVGIPVATIKKFATGNGAAKKAAMIQAARVWGFQVADDADDEADAIALMMYGRKAEGLA